ncbi:tetratricopeptide repeat protein [Kitasatospora sp. NPDC127111]|uniref:tetratricopeptide repeat protein n=1 Tax=Kitasatospora sp. NPDC127111 TaxID=3345363 RepID=UPI00362ED221
MLRRQLDQAKADYAEGRVPQAAEAAGRIGRAQWNLGTVSADAADTLAIAAAAGVLLGLCKLADQPESLAEEIPAATREVFARAVKTFESGTEQTALLEEFTDYRGIALALTGAYGAAVPLLRKAIRQHGDSPDVRRALGLALWRSGKPTEALHELREATRNAPDEWQTQELLATVLADHGASPAEVAAAWAAASQAHLAVRHIPRAVTTAERATALAPGDFAAALALGTALAAAGGSRTADVLRTAVSLAASASDRAMVGYKLLEAGLPREAIRAVEADASDLAATPDGLIVLIQALALDGRAKEAAGPLDRLKELLPRHPVVHLLDGQVSRALGRIDEAVAALRTADWVDPRNPFILVELASAQIEQGATDEALETLRRALQVDPHYVNALILRAQLRATGAERDADPDAYPEAIADLRQAVDLAPWRSPALPVLAELLILADRLEDARELVDGLTYTDGDWPAGWALRGDVLTAQGHHQAAETSYRRALALQPDSVEALTGMASAILNSHGPQDRTATVDAERLARRAVAQDATHAAAHAVLGEALRRLDDHEAAITELREAIRLAPPYWYAVATLGQALLAADRTEEAVGRLEEALAHGQDDWWAHASLGEAYLRTSDDFSDQAMTADDSGTAARLREEAAAANAKAAEQLETAARQAGENPDVFEQLAFALFRHQRHDDAVLAHRHAVELDPDSWERRATLGELLIAVGRNSEALAELDLLVNAGVATREVLALRGRALYWLDEYNGAVEQLRRALPPEGVDAGPEDAETLYCLGDAYRLLGRFDEALDFLDRAVAVAPDHDGALASLGVLHLNRGEDQQAVDNLTLAVKIDPTNRFALQRLWLLENDRGRLRSGLAAVEQARTRRPDDPELSKEYAAVLSVADRDAEALRILAEVLKQQPDDVEAVQLIGRVSLHAGNLVEALGAYRRAVRLAERTGADDSVVIGLLTELAVTESQCGLFFTALATAARALARARTRDALLTLGDLLSSVAAWPQAVAAFEEAVLLPPFESSGFAAFGWALEHNEPVDIAKVLGAYERACALAVGDPAPLRHRSNGYLLAGRLDEAELGYRKVVERLSDARSTDSPTLHDLGWCLYRLKLHDLASATYLRALATSDDPAMLLFDMGLNSLERGDPVTAETAYLRALAEIGRKSDLLARAPLAVALHDLRLARAVPAGAEQARRETEIVLKTELARRPLPAALGSPVQAERSPVAA